MVDWILFHVIFDHSFDSVELNNIIHTSPEEIVDFQPDYFIAASGYESRAICVANKFGQLECKKIAFGFDERLNDLSRPGNDMYFKSQGFRQIKQKTHGTQVLWVSL